MRALARAGSRMGVDARLGLPPVGPGGRSGLRSGALVSGIGSFGNAEFFGSCGNSLLLAENYNRTTTNSTTEAESAQRLHGGGRNRLQHDDLVGFREFGIGGVASSGFIMLIEVYFIAIPRCLRLGVPSQFDYFLSEYYHLHDHCS